MYIYIYIYASARQAGGGLVPPSSPGGKWAIPVRGADAMRFDVLVRLSTY